MLINDEAWDGRSMRPCVGGYHEKAAGRLCKQRVGAIELQRADGGWYIFPAGARLDHPSQCKRRNLIRTASAAPSIVLSVGSMLVQGALGIQLERTSTSISSVFLFLQRFERPNACLSWIKRKWRLRELLESHGDEEEDGLVLDRLVHDQSVIGKTSRTIEIDSIQLQDKDFQVVGKLDYGQFDVIDVVKCKLDGRAYVHKTIKKKFVIRVREQCSPQLERDILRLAITADIQWLPHLLCAFQTPAHLKLIMYYAEGGTLWDMLESSALDGRNSERDIRWWAPQIVSAIHWCHSQGFVHRNIKPHNFVLKPNAHILLFDFGTAAPLLPRMPDGSQHLPKQHCLVPCGTDYISPETLKAHERALLALEMKDDDRSSDFEHEDDVYGRETDWWSMGAMLFEMAYGQAPFFAEDIRRTYAKIMADNRYIPFNNNIIISPEFQDFLRK
ncbi:kinase-like protein [Armillaria gallica]|uniref:Kinase-like protein n=1 Tax=Armillaria gallica TaxID=47427 RepID=A0A2H3D340_ARMGA|nr:kinase-like protein [Armillaria gallica]